MNRRISAICLLLLLPLGLPSATLAGVALPEGGVFKGTGTWEGQDGSSGRYTIEASIRGTTIHSVYTYEGEGKPEQRTVTMTLAADAEGGLQVLDEKRNRIGSASCLADQCLLMIETGPVRIVETIRVKGRSFEAFGTKSGPGFAIVYSSLLIQQD